MPNLSKMYERLSHDQVCAYLDKDFCKASLRLCNVEQHCLLVIIEKMKETRDKNKVCATVLTDLNKAFDFLKHDLLIAKLHASGFDYKYLRVMYAYLNNSVQVTKVGFYYREIFGGFFWVPQGSILGLLTF